MTVYVYGASDDLIEIEGDMNEEFGVTDSDPRYLGFSDGTLLKITYDGDWNIKRISEHPSGVLYHAGSKGSDDAAEFAGIKVSPYSDLFVLQEKVSWVIYGSGVIK